MGLSSFPVAAEGLLPLLVMNTALSVSHVKTTWRSLLQAIAGGAAAEAEARDPAPREEDAAAAAAARRKVRVKTVWSECGCDCSCCVCLCGFEAEEEVSELNCKHFFHRVCLERWFENGHRTCPLCRSVL
ncbi:hypothetical protein BT93_H1249 [Corymbia citriodora subsp. variegata]|nr:hypothetical protein BT93_H1249 [Corymbia citriodora subsp. variegata]